MDSQLRRDGHDVAMNADWQVSSWDVLVPEHEERQGLARLANRPGKSNSGIYWVQRRATVLRWERQPASLGHAGGWVLSLPETFQWNINAVSFQFIHNVYKPVPVLVVLSSVKVFCIPGRDSSKVRNHSNSLEIRRSPWMIFFLVIWEAQVKNPELIRVSDMSFSSQLCLVAGLLEGPPGVVLQESWSSS